MKERPTNKVITDCNLSTIKQNGKARDNLRNALSPDNVKKLPVFGEQLMVRPIQIRENLLYPPSEVQKQLLSRPPVICEKDLQSILEVLRKTGSVFEKTPGVFSVHSAEELRNIITSNLNINFAGNTAQELFLPQGRTLFCLKAEDKNIFIGKCTSWKSMEAVVYSTDSILSESVSPECKAALLIFNKSESQLKNVVNQTRKALLDHSALISMYGEFGKNSWSMIMKSSTGLAIRIHLHVMIYDLYWERGKSFFMLDENERKFFAKL